MDMLSYALTMYREEKNQELANQDMWCFCRFQAIATEQLIGSRIPKNSICQQHFRGGLNKTPERNWGEDRDERRPRAFFH